MSAVAITLNGERTTLEEGTTLRGLLERLRVAESRVAVEHNGRVLRGDELAAAIADGDEVEVVQFVGGG